MDNVSGKTSYLVLGQTLANGEAPTSSRKYKEATTRNIPILDQEAFFALMATSQAVARPIHKGKGKTKL